MTNLNDNVDKLNRFLRDQGYETVELENGLQVRCDSGYVIEINALTRDSDYFWASIEMKNIDPEKQRMEIASVREPLAASLSGLATMGAFEKTQDTDDRFVYVANVELDPTVIYHGAINMDDVSATELPPPPPRVDVILRKQEQAGEMKQAARGAVSPEKPESAPQKKPAAKPRADGIPKETKPSVEMKPVPRKAADLLPAARDAVAQMETIDGKMIRQSLDMMNLRRSSNIRLALMRISRSAVEPGELMRSIREEAEKIMTEEDRQDLKMVRILSENSFLAPVVSLLCREVEKRSGL